METLSKLFGSADRVKIMKLFLSNDDQVFDNGEISGRAKVKPIIARKELALLNKIGFIKKKTCYKEVDKKSGNKIKTEKVKTNGWILDANFSLTAPLKNLLIKSSPLKSKEVIERLKNGGVLKLVITAGVFIQDSDSRADILIVGDNLNNSYLEKAIHILESEIGKELRYVILDTPDFKYRLGVYDKLLKDILDFSHKKLINRLDL
ncbi:MAG: hypothetical protein ABIG87_02155 [Patescibacteria group bacterium]